MFKVGDRVVATTPIKSRSCNGVYWVRYMDRYAGRILTVKSLSEHSIKVEECNWDFDYEWLIKTSKFKGNTK